MGLILFLIVGALAGWLASRFMNQSQGLLMNVIVGVVGAYIGGFLFGMIGIGATGIIGSLILATGGAVVLLWVLGKVRD